MKYRRSQLNYTLILFTIAALLSSCVGAGGGSTQNTVNSTSLNNATSTAPVTTVLAASSCLTANMNLTSDSYNVSGYINIVNTCNTAQSLADAKISFPSQNVATRPILLGSFVDNNDYIAPYYTNFTMKFTQGQGNLIIGAITAGSNVAGANSIPANRTFKFTLYNSPVYNAPFDVALANNYLMLNDAYIKTPTPIVTNPAKCVTAQVNFSGKDNYYLNGSIGLTNNCSTYVSLINYTLGFNAVNTGGLPVTLTPLSVYANDSKMYLNLKSLSGGQVFGTITADSQYPYLAPKQSILVPGGLNVNSTYPNLYQFNQALAQQTLTVNAPGIVAANLPSVNFNDSLNNIPVGSSGLKAFSIVNYSPSTINNLSFPVNMPTDLSYDLSRTTCLLNGKQNLPALGSCTVVFKYTPKNQGVSSSYSARIMGVDAKGTSILDLAINLPFTSRITTAIANGVVINSNTPMTQDISFTTPSSSIVTFRNSLLNIPIGSFGLYAYMVTNNTASNLNSLTLIGALPSGVTNDTTRTTCNLDNKHGLSAGQSCLLVFKYSPTIANSNSQFTIRLAAYDDYYRIIGSLPISYAYSSR